MDAARTALIARETGVAESSVAAAIALFEKGHTVPFVARYRKEAVGGLAEAQVIAIHEHFLEHRETLDRRDSLLKLLSSQGRLTDELRKRIESCTDRIELEDLYLLSRPKRRSPAAEAVEKGLEPLAEYIWCQDPDAWSIQEHAEVFVDAQKNVADREQALRGATDIIAEWIADNCEYRRKLREMLWREGQIVSSVVPSKAGQKTKYTMYYDRKEPVAKIPSHRVLAIRRGCKEGILTSSIQGDHAAALRYLLGAVIRDPESEFAPFLEAAARDGYFRLIRPAIETEVRAMLKQRADREAIRVFRENLENLLLSPPAGQIPVLGVDPGKADECRLAAVGPAGEFLEEAAISPLPPKNDIEGARAIVCSMVARHNIQAVAIAGGNRARDVEAILRRILAEENLQHIVTAAVNDAGIAVYASSRTAREEFPQLAVATRVAVSIARRLQDPLAELVKIDPKLIGVGQYQHDVDQKELHRGLMQCVQSCVNRVGVDPNRAQVSLLRYVAGLNERLARKIVDHRNANGPFRSRAALMQVPGLGEFTFQQAAGFLRIAGAENPLDGTAIHPEWYSIVEKMAAAAGVTAAELVGNRERIETLRLEDFAGESVGLPTLEDIKNELLHPGRDPRKKFAAPRFRHDVKDIASLQEGMILEGIVTNVTNFGAFVDIGIQQDGLVHLSQISNRFIRDPREAVRVGDVVQVKVISVEPDTRRIGLSIKALLPPPARRRRRVLRRPAETAPAEIDDAASLPPESGAAQGREGRPAARNRRFRPGRPPKPEIDIRDRQAAASPNPEPEPPPPPEPSLHKKIALLQSKFRGID